MSNELPNTETPATKPAKPRKPPGRRTRSNDEFEARVFYAAQLLSQLTPRGDVKRALKGRYQCSTSMALKYIARAQRKIEEWTGQGDRPEGVPSRRPAHQLA
jgi:hypothetical protein